MLSILALTYIEGVKTGGACRALMMSSCMVLLGCYSPNQAAFEKKVRTIVQPGMVVSDAIDKLSSNGFACSGDHPITCSRVRQRLLPSSCVERVNLEPGDRAAVLSTVDVRPIACAGF
jgi:hypothetical protein